MSSRALRGAAGALVALGLLSLSPRARADPDALRFEGILVTSLGGAALAGGVTAVAVNEALAPPDFGASSRRSNAPDVIGAALVVAGVIAILNGVPKIVAAERARRPPAPPAPGKPDVWIRARGLTLVF
ncbi:MAG TPA: hypothetical protein VGM56_17375 [Byssovorax sp.]